MINKSTSALPIIPGKINENPIVEIPKSKTMATPKPAPELIPKTDGPASGFLNKVCNNNPEVASPAPAINAVIVLGNLEPNTMFFQPGFSEEFENKISKTFPKGILTEPKIIFRRDTTIIKIIIPNR